LHFKTQDERAIRAPFQGALIVFIECSTLSLEETQVKTLVATAALTIIFLSAGAFAGTDTRNATVAKSPITNVTVIVKNGQWPMKGQFSLDSCKLRRCLDV
jgi:hypothetical protein